MFFINTIIVLYRTFTEHKRWSTCG